MKFEDIEKANKLRTDIITNEHLIEEFENIKEKGFGYEISGCSYHRIPDSLRDKIMELLIAEYKAQRGLLKKELEEL